MYPVHKSLAKLSFGRLCAFDNACQQSLHTGNSQSLHRACDEDAMPSLLSGSLVHLRSSGQHKISTLPASNGTLRVHADSSFCAVLVVRSGLCPYSFMYESMPIAACVSFLVMLQNRSRSITFLHCIVGCCEVSSFDTQST